MATVVETITKVPQTKLKLDYADIPVLDLSLFDQVDGKAKLEAQVKEAVEQTGFFYVTNFGISEDEIERQFSLGKRILNLPDEEKLKYRAKLEDGDYNGYRPLGAIEQFPGRRDNWECYHIFKFLPENERPHPDIVNQHMDDIKRFHNHIHQSVAYRVLRLIANVLQMPEETLVDKHRYEDSCSSFLRYVKYHARDPAVNKQYSNIYVRGHTDFGSVTFLFSQPIGGLQLQTRDGGWRDVRHIPGSIVVNTADMMHFWTHGYLKSCVHRVVAPPADQEHLDRYGLIYFLRPGSNKKLQALDSPLLRELGINGDNESADLKAKREVTVGEWVPIQTKRNWTPFDQQAQSDKAFQSLFR